MTGRNIKVPGHALKPPCSINKYRVECYCGAWGNILGHIGADARRQARRNWHDDHKIEVLRSKDKLEEM